MPFDIGIGLIIGVLLSTLSGINYQLSLLIGVLACLLPDLDYLWRMAKYRTLPKSDHRDGLHYPLILIPIVGVIGITIDNYIGMALILGTLIHFLHDSIGVGWGVKWLFPFNNKSYMFLYRAGLPTNTEMSRNLIYSWTDKERYEGMAKYGDKNWIKHIYFSFHPFGIMEYSVLAIGLFTAYYFR